MDAHISQRNVCHGRSACRAFKPQDQPARLPLRHKCLSAQALDDLQRIPGDQIAIQKLQQIPKKCLKFKTHFVFLMCATHMPHVHSMGLKGLGYYISVPGFEVSVSELQDPYNGS